MKWHTCTVDPTKDTRKENLKRHKTSRPLIAANKVTGIRFTSCLEQPKKLDKIYELTIFKTLNQKQQRIAFPKIWKIKEMSPIMGQFITCLSHVSRPWHREMKPAWSLVRTWVRADSLGKLKRAEFMNARGHRLLVSKPEDLQSTDERMYLENSGAGPVPTSRLGEPHHSEGTGEGSCQ